jgi:hypothetical protein
MIGVLDQIEVNADNLAALQLLIGERYAPAAAARGMKLARSWIAPPVTTSMAPNTVWVLWELADIGAWWGMRARAGADPETVAYWAAIDKLCNKRERHYLIDGAPAAAMPVLAAPLPVSAVAIKSADGARESAQLFLRSGASDNDIAALEAALRAAPQHIAGLRRVFLMRNLEGSFGAGDYTWDADFVDAAARRNAAHSEYQINVLQPLLTTVIEREWRMGTQLIGGGLRDPVLKNGIKRTAYFRLLPNAPAAATAQLEQALLQMPAYMLGMTNWSLSRAVDSDWSYVWEQEYARLDDLLGEYMVHPIHWAYIDPWFDPEFSRQIISTQLSHAFCSAADSVLAWR